MAFGNVVQKVIDGQINNRTLTTTLLYRALVEHQTAIEIAAADLGYQLHNCHVSDCGKFFEFGMQPEQYELLIVALSYMD